MAGRNKRITTIVALIVVLVAFFQMLWPRLYPWVVSRNPYPTHEYFQIMGFVSPNGLSILAVIIGLIFIAWAAVTDP
ncbi:MAG TPA: hypothetical protein VKO45_00190 [Methanomicrobiales archaeon]|nr:hypothetical protein [Methanomicrobiales archaeon]